MPPTINRQTPRVAMVVTPTAPTAPPGSILSTAMPVTQLRQDCVIATIYGRNRSGKTTTAAQFPKPLLFLTCEPAHCGGVQSVSNMEGVSVIEIPDKLLPGKTMFGRKMIEAIGRELASDTYYRTVVLKTATSLQDIVFEEIKREFGDNMPTGKTALRDIFGLRAGRLHDAMYPLLSLRNKHVVVLAQEKDHNPPTDDKTGFPDIKAKLLQHMQSGSFMAAALGAANAQWLYDATGYYMQLYDDEVQQDVVIPTRNPDGTPGLTVTQRVGTGRRQRHLRLQYHPNFAAGGKWNYDPNLPEFITAPTPQGLYAELIKYIPALR